MLEEYDENATTTEPVSLEVSPENESKLRVLLSMIRWEDKEVSMSRMPEYTLEFRENSTTYGRHPPTATSPSSHLVADAIKVYQKNARKNLRRF